MFVEGFPSDGRTQDTDNARLGALRVRGGLSLAVAAIEGRSRLTDLEERGGYRAKFPQSELGFEAVAINTGGGLVGGDEVAFSIAVADGAIATVATQSAERVYRAKSTATRTEVRLSIGAKGMLAWLPQETILFDGARLTRRIEVDMARDASLLMAEAVVFGREAMGENVRSGHFRDRWTIRRDGQLAYVEAVSFDGDMHASLQRHAIGAGARATATVLYIAPDAEERRDDARAALDGAGGRAAISTWNGMLVGRFLAPSAAQLRKDLVLLASYLARKPMPRVWNC